MKTLNKTVAAIRLNEVAVITRSFLNINVQTDGKVRLSKVGGRGRVVQNGDELVEMLLQCGFSPTRKDAIINEHGSFPPMFEWGVLLDVEFIAGAVWWREIARLENGAGRNQTSIVVVDCSVLAAAIGSAGNVQVVTAETMAAVQSVAKNPVLRRGERAEDVAKAELVPANRVPSALKA